MEIDFSKIEQYNRQYQKWLQAVPAVYNYDNCLCCCFAHLLSNQAEKDGFKASKVCALVSDRGDSSQGVSAFMQNSQGGFEQVKWDYHTRPTLIASASSWRPSLPWWTSP